VTLALRLRRLGLLGVLLLAASPAASPARAASLPPDLRFRSIVTARVTVHFHQGIEPQARLAAALADEILADLEARYRTRVGRVQIVLADESDDANGFTLVFPRPLVRLTIAASDGTDELGNYESWLRLLLTHELAHVVHMDMARGLARVGRHVFGRAPFLFPNGAAASWMVEGLATREETRGTAFGRGRDADARMMIRMAALEERFPREDQATVGLDRWPQGHAPYIFGEAFLRDLEGRFGAETVPDLVRAHAAWPLPYLDEATSLVVTRGSFADRWGQWARSTRAAAESEAAGLAARGLTATTPLTRKGVRQTGARFSPDGTLIAYTSGTLTRQREIRVMAADGTGDHAVARRNGGTGLAWTPDGSALVFDEPDNHRLFRYWSDLKIVDLATRRVRRLTRGLRAADPDVAPDGRSVVFVRRTESGSELATAALDGTLRGDLTRSAPGTIWSKPRVSPRGDALVATRWVSGGFLDVILVDLATGRLVELTHDRAEDAEPTWSPDGVHVVFRSDRDGISNLYALRLTDSVILRVTRVLGGAFAPCLDPPTPEDVGHGSGSRLVFSSYSSSGYDLHEMRVALADLPQAEPFADPYAPSHPDPEPVTIAARPYRPWTHLLPRYWMPYLGGSSDATRLGVTTSGFDPLLRHSYVLTVHRTSQSGRWGFEGVYAYDRLRPTLFLAAKDVTDPMDDGLVRTRQVVLSASYPLRRSVRSSQALALAWRGEEQRFDGWQERCPKRRLSGLEASWTLGSARQYPFTVSPVEGARLRVSAEQELPALGSDASMLKLAVDGRAYLRVRGTHALALRGGAATTLGERQLRRTFSAGGFPTGDLFDLFGARPGVLRGYPDDAFSGRHLVYANAEYRFPLTHPQRGLWSLPAFVRHLHGALFVDVGQAWTGEFTGCQMKTALGAALGTDTFMGHALPVTGTVGLARGLSDKGETRIYFRLGLAF
jgi:Tol biopolymer transport system component